MSVIVVAQVTIAEGEAAALARYLEVTTPLLEQVGAQIVQHFTLTEVVVGFRPGKSLIIVSYPSREAVEFVFSSEAYRMLIPIRDRAFESYSVTIADHSSPAPNEKKASKHGRCREKVEQQ